LLFAGATGVDWLLADGFENGGLFHQARASGVDVSGSGLSDCLADPGGAADRRGADAVFVFWGDV